MFWLVDVFTSVTEQPQKDGIIKAFTERSQLRIMIATVAFGMGIDCPDVQHIVHQMTLSHISKKLGMQVGMGE